MYPAICFALGDQEFTNWKSLIPNDNLNYTPYSRYFDLFFGNTSKHLQSIAFEGRYPWRAIKIIIIRLNPLSVWNVKGGMELARSLKDHFFPWLDFDFWSKDIITIISSSWNVMHITETCCCCSSGLEGLKTWRRFELTYEDTKKTKGIHYVYIEDIPDVFCSYVLPSRRALKSLHGCMEWMCIRWWDEMGCWNA